ncbi:hypothetical protein NL50_17205 [Clostridium acetobutylicum]|nr:hypothetical protein NL50_17205 [Clostridium acetobutylicum]
MADVQEEVKTEDTEKVTKPVKIEVKLIKNIKHGKKCYKIGDKVKINKDDLEEFKNAKVIVEE